MDQFWVDIILSQMVLQQLVRLVPSNQAAIVKSV
jgi:hypothetical protein